MFLVLNLIITKIIYFPNFGFSLQSEVQDIRFPIKIEKHNTGNWITEFIFFSKKNKERIISLETSYPIIGKGAKRESILNWTDYK